MEKWQRNLGNVVRIRREKIRGRFDALQIEKNQQRVVTNTNTVLDRKENLSM